MIGVLSEGDIQGVILGAPDEVLTYENPDPNPMGPTYCLSGPGPLAPGQIYCPGVLDTAQTLSGEILGGQTSGTSSLSSMFSNIPTWVLALGGVAAVMLLIPSGGGRRR